MYCSKCGNLCGDDQQFCSKCGSPLGATQTQNTGAPANAGTNAPMQLSVASMRDNFIAGMAELGKNRNRILANIILIVLAGILSLTNVFRISLAGFSSNGSMFHGAGGLGFICIVLHLGAGFLMVVPLLFKKVWSGLFFIATKVVSILTLLLFVGEFFAVMSEMEGDLFGSLADFGPSFFGWLFLASEIAALVLAFINGAEMKKYKLQRDFDTFQKQQQNVAQQQQNPPRA